MSALYSWLIAGVAFLVFEALGMPGAGLLFAGLGALATGSFIHLGYIAQTDTLMQFITFFLTSGVFAVLLWKPIQKFKGNQQKNKFNNIVGDTAVVGKDGLGANGGEVKWSGTIMTAKLADDVTGTLASGTKVVITDVQGTTLVVKPK